MKLLRHRHSTSRTLLTLCSRFVLSSLFNHSMVLMQMVSCLVTFFPFIFFLFLLASISFSPTHSLSLSIMFILIFVFHPFFHSYFSWCWMLAPRDSWRNLFHGYCANFRTVTYSSINGKLDNSEQWLSHPEVSASYLSGLPSISNWGLFSSVPPGKFRKRATITSFQIHTYSRASFLFISWHTTSVVETRSLNNLKSITISVHPSK